MPDAFRFEELDGRIGLLTFDQPESKVNTLSRATLTELAGWVGRLGGRTDLRGLLFRSGKSGQFVAGADLKEIGALAFASKEEVEQAVGLGHQVFDRISRLPFPTVALIDGNCLGGGAELAQAMDARIASNSPLTKIGQPEVKVGILPAWGGTQRLPRLIGLNAIEMICGGEPISAAKAAALGLVFDAVPTYLLVEEGVRLIEHLLRTGAWKSNRERLQRPLGLSPDQVAFAFATAEGQIRSKTKGHYPAPLVALRAIREGINLPLDEALKVEQRAAVELVGSPVAANMVAIFFMKNRLDRDPGVNRTDVTSRPVHHVGVVGAGLMGSGIAAAHARSGIQTAMVDVDDARLANAMKRVREVVASRIKIGRATLQDMADMLGRLSHSTRHSILGDADVVIEAITEDERAKTSIYRELGKVLRDDAILASNTSTISITRMAESAPDPARFVGMHFFHPVDRMELVEVIRGKKTSDETVVTIVALAKRIKKTPIVVQDCPGFLVNRVLFPYMSEALLLLMEGVPMDAIDAAATQFGMPVGPIALHDMVGLDTALYAGQVLTRAYPDRSVPVPLLQELVQAGHLGQKSGAGFRISSGKRSEPNPAFATILEQHRTEGQGPPGAEEITDRLFLVMLLEATRVLEEGIVRAPADVDMGLILGTGFPPFRGGILRWCDTEGAGKVLDRLERYGSLGKRFEPTATLIRHAQTGALFYPMPKLTTASV